MLFRSHGDPEGNFVVGGDITNPHQIAAAILENPAYDGGAINLVTCYGELGSAQELRRILGVRVTASQLDVDLDPHTGYLRETPWMQ